MALIKGFFGKNLSATKPTIIEKVIKPENNNTPFIIIPK
jgi:hypothetical protein